MAHSSVSTRRQFFWRLLGAAVGSGMLVVPWRRVAAMGARDIPQGIRRIEGRVEVNGRPAAVGAPVAPGDEVATGPDSLTVFVVGASVYLLRDGSRLKIEADGQRPGAIGRADRLRLMAGKMLAVFEKGSRRLTTPTVVAAVRGSAVYVEAKAGETYLCTCYGASSISSRQDPEVRETVVTTYHDAPRWIRETAAGAVIEPAPVIRHTDAELIMLEAMAFRQPPFAGSGQSHY